MSRNCGGFSYDSNWKATSYRGRTTLKWRRSSVVTSVASSRSAREIAGEATFRLPVQPGFVEDQRDGAISEARISSIRFDRRGPLRPLRRWLLGFRIFEETLRVDSCPLHLRPAAALRRLCADCRRAIWFVVIQRRGRATATLALVGCGEGPKRPIVKLTYRPLRLLPTKGLWRPGRG